MMNERNRARLERLAELDIQTPQGEKQLSSAAWKGRFFEESLDLIDRNCFRDENEVTCKAYAEDFLPVMEGYEWVIAYVDQDGTFGKLIFASSIKYPTNWRFEDERHPFLHEKPDAVIIPFDAEALYKEEFDFEAMNYYRLIKAD